MAHIKRCNLFGLSESDARTCLAAYLPATALGKAPTEHPQTEETQLDEPRVKDRDKTRWADIFVSYTDSDRRWAFWIGRELEKLGHRPRIHDWEIQAGGDIPRWMEECLEKADRALCVISSAYLTQDYSSWAARSAQWAAASQRPNFILPVFIEDCEPPVALAHIKRCNLFGLSKSEARDRLATYLAEPGPLAELRRFSRRPLGDCRFVAD